MVHQYHLQQFVIPDTTNINWPNRKENNVLDKFSLSFIQIQSLVLEIITFMLGSEWVFVKLLI